MSCPRPNTERSNPKDWGEIAQPLRDRAWTMAQDYGLYLVSGYRDPGRQWDLRHDRVPGRECDPSAKAHPATAVPAQFINGQWVGGSHHQHRQAVDLGGARLGEARRNCASYGLDDCVPTEAWHYETAGSPSRPIRSYPGPSYDDPPVQLPKEWLDMTPEELSKMLDAKLAPIKAEVAELHDQLIGTKDGAPDEALRQLLRRIDSTTTSLRSLLPKKKA